MMSPQVQKIENAGSELAEIGEKLVGFMGEIGLELNGLLWYLPPEKNWI
jgi:hypothetical protein